MAIAIGCISIVIEKCTMESLSNNSNSTQEHSSSCTTFHSKWLVTEVEDAYQDVLLQVPVEEIEPSNYGVIVLAVGSETKTMSPVIAVETEPCSSGVVVLLNQDVPVKREV